MQVENFRLKPSSIKKKNVHNMIKHVFLQYSSDQRTYFIDLINYCSLIINIIFFNIVNIRL